MGVSRQGVSRDTVRPPRCVRSMHNPGGFTVVYPLGGIKQSGNVGTAVW